MVSILRNYEICVLTTRRWTDPVSRPLYQAKAEFFKTLGHPVRIRVLELLSVREHGGVSELVAEIDIEPANLSQQLAVLRRAGW